MSAGLLLGRGAAGGGTGVASVAGGLITQFRTKTLRPSASVTY